MEGFFACADDVVQLVLLEGAREKAPKRQALGVVTPALFPIVPELATFSGFDPVVLFTAIVLGAQASAISPFSSGGSLVLGACPEKYKEELFKKLLFKAIPIGFIAAILASVILMEIL